MSELGQSTSEVSDVRNRAKGWKNIIPLSTYAFNSPYNFKAREMFIN